MKLKDLVNYNNIENMINPHPKGEIILKPHKKQDTYYKRALKVLKKTKCNILGIHYIDNDIIINYEVNI